MELNFNIKLPIGGYFSCLTNGAGSKEGIELFRSRFFIFVNVGMAFGNNTCI